MTETHDSTSAGTNTKPRLPAWASLTLILLVALVHGLIYIFIVPPWQHYDEPSHFEYAWLIANRMTLPKSQDFDAALNRSVIESMWEHGFFGDPANKPVIPADPELRMPGYTQLNDPPLYYMLAALPMVLTRSQDVASQLIASRFISLIFLLVTVFAAWGITREISPPSSPLRWAVPLTIAMLPGFIDLMTALNNDVGGVVLFSLFLWSAVRLIQRGFSWLDFLLAGFWSGLTLLTRNTALPAILFLPLVLVLSLVSGRKRRFVWAAAAGLVVLVAVFIFEGGDAAGWFRSTSQNSLTRVADEAAVVGNYHFRFEPAAPVTPEWVSPVFQPVIAWEPRENFRNYMTFGAWMWANRPMEARLPTVYVNGIPAANPPVRVGLKPQFFAYSVPMPEASLVRLWVLMQRSGSNDENGVELYYDGMVLADGKRSLDTPPTYSNAMAESGDWGGATYTNLLTNGSAEKSGVRVRPAIDQAGALFLPDSMRPSFILASFLNLSKTRELLYKTAERLYRTFWGYFGWGHIPLLGGKPYRWLGIVSLLGIIGLMIAIIRSLRTRVDDPPVHVWLLFGLAILVVGMITSTRGMIYFALPKIQYPVARYTYPVIVPIMYFLGMGWMEILYGIGGLLRLPKLIPNLIYMGGLLALDVLAIVSITRFYAEKLL